MSIHYSVQELLQLRESPLVKKPDGLPPTEQWMGPLVDTNQRRPGQPRSKADEGTSNDYEKRPSLLDTHVTRRSTTATENIVLGPPKTAFASSSSTRHLGRTTTNESGDATSLESPRLTKSFAREQDADDGDNERRGGRFGALNGRRYDREEWGTRSRRDTELDELERRPRRDFDSRWNKKSSGFGDEPRKGAREEARYGKPGRARFEQPWFRGENGEALEDDGKFPQRSRGWTRDRRSGGPSDDWNARPEQDPEWMDTLEAEEPKQAHTAEDFQKWKERMKADNDKRATPSEATEAFEGLSVQEKESAPKAQPKIKPDTDKFFEIFGEKEVTDDAPAMVESKKHKTRFAALFSPPPEEPKSAVEPIETEVPAPSNRPASTDADQEGFQRILQMLGGKGKANALPLEALFNPKPGSSRVEQASPNSLPGLFMNQDFSKSEQQISEAKPPSRSSGGLESLLGPQSPRSEQKRDSAPNKDGDLLLRLMQQSKMTPSPQLTQQQGPQSNHIPGILQIPEALNRPHQPVKSPSELPSFFDDPAIANSQRMPPSQIDNFDLHQRLGLMPPMQNDYPTRSDYPKSSQDQPPHPPSMQRPPGFDSIPPPAGWPHQHPHHPQHQQFPPPPQQQGHMNAPLGMPGPAQSRGMPPFHPGGPPMPPQHNMSMPPSQESRQQPPQQQQQPRKMPGSGGAPFPPPGMQPPPGFMGNHPGGLPPPGFLPMPMGGNDGMGGMPMGAGPRDMGGPPHQQGMPPRHLMDLFAMGGGGGDRGGRVGGAAGGGMPGPYR